MELVGAVLVVIIFVLLIQVVGLVKHTREVISCSKASIAVLTATDLDDEIKEARLQQHAKRLFVLLGLLVLCGLSSLFIPLFIIWVLDLLGVMTLAGVLVILQRWDFLLVATVLGLLAFKVMNKTRQ